MTEATNGLCVDCVYLANDGKWCAKIEGYLKQSDRTIFSCNEFVRRNKSMSTPFGYVKDVMSAEDLVLIAKAEWEQKDAAAMEARRKWERLEAQSICASCGKPK